MLWAVLQVSLTDLFTTYLSVKAPVELTNLTICARCKSSIRLLHKRVLGSVLRDVNRNKTSRHNRVLLAGLGGWVPLTLYFNWSLRRELFLGSHAHKYKNVGGGTILREQGKRNRNMREHVFPLVFPELFGDIPSLKFSPPGPIFHSSFNQTTQHQNEVFSIQHKSRRLILFPSVHTYVTWLIHKRYGSLRYHRAPQSISKGDSSFFFLSVNNILLLC